MLSASQPGTEHVLLQARQDKRLCWGIAARGDAFSRLLNAGRKLSHRIYGWPLLDRKEILEPKLGQGPGQINVLPLLLWLSKQLQQTTLRNNALILTWRILWSLAAACLLICILESIQACAQGHCEAGNLPRQLS